MGARGERNKFEKEKYICIKCKRNRKEERIMEKVKRYSISLVISFCVAAIFLIISSAIFAYTNINDRHLDSFVLGSVMISVLVGSMLLLRKIKKKGLLFGAIFGLIYFLIVYLVNVLAFSEFFVSNTVEIYLGICLLSGIVGGIIGVNI